MADKKSNERTIGSVVAHPLRSRCLTRLAERTASPAELAIEFRKPLSDVSYHVATLLKAGAIELVGERPVRGSIQHFYRATSVPASENGDSLNGDERLAFVRQSFQLAAADATMALEAQTLDRRPGACFSRQPLVVDEAGWEELASLYDEMVERIAKIGADSAERGGENGSENGSENSDEGVTVTAFVTFFERPSR